ncbi:MAG: cytochrome c [Gammaproteobacteria bacterium]|nr:cytochrome c [Gammaproteobacteria bacterium]
MGFIRTATIAAVLAGVSIVALADDPFETEIKARQGLMNVYKYNIGILGAMAKGQMDFDAEAAQMAADNIQSVATMKNGGLWPQGSDSDAVDSKAKAAIWEAGSKVGEYSQKMAEAATAMAANAGSLDGVKAAMKDLGGSCKSCHDDYRLKD